MTRAKHYMLKKDLPTFAAGDEFELRADGCLYLYRHRYGYRDDDNDNVMAYSRRTLERFPGILEDWFKETVAPSWVPSCGESYCYIGEEGDVRIAWMNMDGIDHARIRFGNCFRTCYDAASAKSIVQDAILNFKERLYGEDE